MNNHFFYYLGRHLPSSVPTKLLLGVVLYRPTAVTAVPTVGLTSHTPSFVGTTPTGAASPALMTIHVYRHILSLNGYSVFVTNLREVCKI